MPAQDPIRRSVSCSTADSARDPPNLLLAHDRPAGKAHSLGGHYSNAVIVAGYWGKYHARFDFFIAGGSRG
jgi:hypothetical protein